MTLLGITLPPERPCCWHCTAARIDKLRADTPVELQPVDKTLRRYACEPEPVAGTVPLLQATLAALPAANQLLAALPAANRLLLLRLQ